MAAAAAPPETVHLLPGSTNLPLAGFPPPADATSADAESEARAAVEALNAAISTANFEAVSRLFARTGYWRDHLALSWNFRTVKGTDGILAFLKHCAQSKDGFRLRRLELDTAGSPVRRPMMMPIDGGAGVNGIHAFFRFETATGAGEGTLRLALEDRKWKIYTIYTCLQELNGCQEETFARRPLGVEHGGRTDGKNWADRRAAQVSLDDGIEPPVLIVGAGQAGLTAAARLQVLGVKALIIDRNGRVGDNWRKRYHQLVLHDPVWYDHMPYLSFPPQWPVFTPKDKLAQFLESYADLMELNVWTNTELANSQWNDKEGAWTVSVTRKLGDGSTQTRELRPRHIIQATGASGLKSQPTFKGAETFKGDVLCHSSEFSGAREGSVGKKAVIVGCCNSAHDIAQDYLGKGYDVTMVQRSSTNVVSSKAILDVAFNGLYAEDGPPVDDSDMIVQGMPLAVLKAVQVKVAALQREHDKEMLDGLAKAGFKVDFGPDDAGLFFKYFQRGGGYYIDVGAAKLIADGSIKIKQGQEISEFLPSGIRFADGSELDADEIILATGYDNMSTQTRVMFGDDVADKVNDAWGLNEEGEMRSIWQKSGHPGLWLHGGNLALCRFYSRLLALQIKGLVEDLYAYGDI
ncbi:hypothetical protein JDV02_008129 [Purpureocillium takamizusanense]|uniref:Flavin-containing monooxygenase n=1 Tax=Purpureocillium takamizusanense TaxID=2060973 RepID=A0A9Q8VD05_9HYPO|nr:uncharacterized protein JDV02_008129 [Purpureocillium takamizusanense]UNI22220.1 hypothetical protein JDV02_008129 [Purpureocillium takamizusanense]